ncbi:MAG: hypothetical protein WDA65_00205 [Christensenellales bacterium]
MYNTITLPKDKRNITKFIDLEFKLYKGDINWVAPLKADTRNMLSGRNNPLFANGEYAFFMSFKDGEPVGRVLAGIDRRLNKEKGLNQGYFSMFECINDNAACKSLLDSACGWLLKKGADSVIGPLSPANSDDRKGFLVMGEGAPVLLNAYTKKYYPRLIETYGFSKNDDHYAYLFTDELFNLERYCAAIEYAKKKGGYKVERFNAKDVSGEARDIKKVLDNSVPPEWDYLSVPTLQAVVDEFKSLAQFYNGRYSFIVRKGLEPIGFLVVLPDYNQVLKRMGGRILPFGWIKFLYYKRKITGARAIVQMVDRNYHNMGVNFAMYYELYKDLTQTKLKYVEASCIDESNIPSRLSVERAGGKHYRTYRTYRYALK